MKKSVVLVALVLLLGSFFLTWFDYRVQRDLTGWDFVAQYRFLLAGLTALAVILAISGQYAMISGLFVLVFLAQLFYAASHNMNRLAPGFFISLVLTLSTGIAVMTLHDKARPNLIQRLRSSAASGRVHDEDPKSYAESSPEPRA